MKSRSEYNQSNNIRLTFISESCVHNTEIENNQVSFITIKLHTQGNNKDATEIARKGASSCNQSTTYTG